MASEQHMEQAESLQSGSVPIAGYPDERFPPPPPAPHSGGRPTKKGGAAALGSKLDEHIARVLEWLRGCSLTEVIPNSGLDFVAASDAVGAVLGSSKKHTWQQTKAHKHRAQIEAIAGHCLRCMSSNCEVVIELGAGQAVLGHAVSMASSLPLVTIERRGNTDAFDGPQGEDGPTVRRIQADIADPSAWPDDGDEVALLAKHLCAHSSDLAVDAALQLGTRLGLLCIAPCCHAKMNWNELSPGAQDWFKEANFPGEAEDFALLCDIIKLSRAGDAEPGKPLPCAKWRLRKHVDPAEINVLGKKASRAIDEARLCRLRAVGLDVALLEYCDEALSPDNVLILAAPQGRASHLSLKPMPQTAATTADSSCDVTCDVESAATIILELDPTNSPTVMQRLVGYLQEQQLSDGRFPSLARAVPLVDEVSIRIPAIACSPRRLPPSAEGVEQSAHMTVLPLLAELLRCPLISRTTVRFLVVDQDAVAATTSGSDGDAVSSAGRVEALAVAVVAALTAEGRDDAVAAGVEPAAQLSVRVASRPRNLEAPIAAALAKHGTSWLSPAHFTHLLCVMSNEQDQRGLRFSLLRRDKLDPTAYAVHREKHMKDTSSRYFEAALRWPRRFDLRRAIALWTDPPASQSTPSTPSPWLLGWADAFMPVGATVAEFHLERRPGCDASATTTTSASDGRGVQDASPPTLSVAVRRGEHAAQSSGEDRPSVPANVLLCEVNFVGDEDAVEALSSLRDVGMTGQAPLLAADGVVIMRLRCGKRPRAVKKWHRDVARLLEVRFGAGRIELLHLLSDKEQERTAVFTWGVEASSVRS